MTAQYRLLADHYFEATGSFPAGTVVTEGNQIPVGWIPSIASEPLNAQAIQNYWNAGPRGKMDAEPSRSIFDSIGAYFVQLAPVIYWARVPGTTLFQLTGAGASLGAKDGAFV